MKKCPKCSQILDDSATYCYSCGFTPSSSRAKPAPNQHPAASKQAPKKKKSSFSIKGLFDKIPKKALIIAAAVIVLAVVIILLSTFAGSSKKDYTLYIKDKELYFSKINDDEHAKITKSLINNSKHKNSANDDLSLYLSRYCIVSDNGKKIFYIDNVNSTKGTSTLYWRKLTNLKKEPTEIAKNVVSYQIDEKYKSITYLTLDGVLSQHNLKEEVKISENVSLYAVSNDGNTIFFVTDNGNLYLKNKDAEKVKLDVNVTDINATDDLSLLYYVSGGTLYKKDLESEKVKISTGVENIAAIYETGEVYYVKTTTSEQSLMNYIIDDMKESDEKMQAPAQPQQPYSWNYSSNSEYEKAKLQYERDKKAYETEIAKYTAKLERDKIRQDSAAGPEEITTYSLFIHDGLKETALAESVYRNDYEVSYDTPVIAFKTYDPKSISKVKISKINSSYEVEEAIEKAFKNSVKQYVAIGNKATLIEHPDACRFRFSEDGKTVYFLENSYPGKDEYNLYKAGLSKEKVKNPKLYDSEVSREGFELLEGKKIKYFKNVKDSSGELIINKKSVDTSVSVQRSFFHEDSKTLYYFTNWDSQSETGVLKKSKGSEAEKIAEKVHIYQVTPDSTVYFISNYSYSSYSGNLYSYQGKEPELIEKNVSGLIPVYNRSLCKFS